MLYLGDSLEILKTLPDNSLDACVTDPPYGLAFMGKKWDYDVPSVELWREVLRVLKPGAHLLSFGGTRTYHRMTVAIEDAGFEVRDAILWHYGSGFPKSLDVSKAIDKAAGAERKVIGKTVSGKILRANGQNERPYQDGQERISCYVTAPSTTSAKQWQGWGTALKPATEIVCLARKPLEKGLTVAQNVEKWGCGAINVDECRIGYQSADDFNKTMRGVQGMYDNKRDQKNSEGWDRPWQHERPRTDASVNVNVQGRWPANVIFDEAAAADLDRQFFYEIGGEIGTGPSRFFYVAKASKRERNAGLEGMPERMSRSAGGTTSSGKPTMEGRDRFGTMTQNHHPTVKPIKLMEYLIKLVTPPGGTVLDPFMGSGSTGVAAKRLGFNFTGIELSPEYFEIAKRRIEHKQEKAQLELEGA